MLETGQKAPHGKSKLQYAIVQREKNKIKIMPSAVYQSINPAGTSKDDVKGLYKQ
jgi:hypothetical protein